jgi:Spy/CpxP family protein refolding chaperone
MTLPPPDQQPTVPPIRRPGRTRLLAGLVMLLIGLTGVALGVALDRAMVRWRIAGAFMGRRPPGSPHSPDVRKWVEERLDRKLDLTDAQRVQLDSILARREQEMRALMRENRPKFEAIAERTRREITALLTPEQQEKFSKMDWPGGRRGR